MWKRGITLFKSDGHRLKKQSDHILMEKRVVVEVGEISMTFHTTPQQEEAMVYGWLWSQGVHFEKGALPVLQKTDKGYVVAGIKRGEVIRQKTRDIRLTLHEIQRLLILYKEKAWLYKDTGISRSVAFSDGKEMLVMAEDMNDTFAFYKAVGELIKHGCQNKAKVILLSGTLDQSMVRDIVNLGVPMIVSRSAPTDQGLDLAQEHRLTLVGFARGKRFNVYCGEGRVKT
ncbi:MAG: formate dehydrogenase accessory sulfurtransferase FdhD [Candidatus Margulisbacteria bacterium]|nr:formate dehydrogenase accessory sulfurtransferase FdhD [Candidatus Margulisiibacteriota bacterium]